MSKWFKQIEKKEFNRKHKEVYKEFHNLPHRSGYDGIEVVFWRYYVNIDNHTDEHRLEKMKYWLNERIDDIKKNPNRYKIF